MPGAPPNYNSRRAPRQGAPLVGGARRSRRGGGSGGGGAGGTGGLSRAGQVRPSPQQGQTPGAFPASSPSAELCGTGVVLFLISLRGRGSGGVLCQPQGWHPPLPPPPPPPPPPVTKSHGRRAALPQIPSPEAWQQPPDEASSPAGGWIRARWAPASVDAGGAAAPPRSWLTSTSSSVASFMSFSVAKAAS
ncbi:protein alan shepard-like [Phaenicophaeus curvirostris]|uniref:protein alan shepard-like n=1 Tax=Phaenicophaeus curvirostris TaxID=33595 RepID=UPI0037F09E3A